MFKGIKTKVVSILMTAMLAINTFPIWGMTEVHAAGDGDPTIEIATWEGFRKGAASFTFEENAPSHISDVAPLFEKYGYNASFYLVVNWAPDWEGFQGLADKGHEIGSHSNSHGQNMKGEEASSKRNIEAKITQKYGCTTVAYPNGNVPNETAVLNNYIAGRTYNGSWLGNPDTMGKDGPSNWAKVPAYLTGSQGSINTADKFTGKMQEVIGKDGWVCFASFGITGKKNGSATYSLTDMDALEGALSWAKQNDKDIWVAPLRNVAMYIKERKASKANIISYDDSVIKCSLKHSIADTVSQYDYPLSLRVKYDKAVADVTQDGKLLESKIEDGYLYFNAVPNGGEIVISMNSKDIKNAEITVSDENCIYDGTEKKPEVTVKINGSTLKEGVDYEIAYTDNINAGDAKITLTGKGEYFGTKELSFKIKAAEQKDPDEPVTTEEQIDPKKPEDGDTNDGNITDKEGYLNSEKIDSDKLKKNAKIADKKSGGKYKITKVTKKNGKVVGGTVTYMKPYNKNCKLISATGKVKLGGVTFTVTAIAPNCAKGCKKLTKLVLGSGIKTIGKNAFAGCKSLKSVTIKTTKLTKKSVGANAFKGIHAKAKIKVPKKKLKDYTKILKSKGIKGKNQKITK